MATKTLILRPTSSNNMDAGGVSVFPSDTSTDNIYLLLNEEVADDDATYVDISTTLASLSLGFTVPNKYLGIDPLSIRIIIRTMTPTPSGAMIQYGPALRVTDGTGKDVESHDPPEDIIFDVYETYNIEVINTQKVWDACITGANFLYIQMRKVSSSSSKNDGSVIRYTQVYIEVDYEGPDTPTAFIKDGMLWKESEAIYIKKNGSWVECDNSSLANGTQYTVLYLNAT